MACGGIVETTSHSGTSSGAESGSTSVSSGSSGGFAGTSGVPGPIALSGDSGSSSPPPSGTNPFSSGTVDPSESGSTGPLAALLGQVLAPCASSTSGSPTTTGAPVGCTSAPPAPLVPPACIVELPDCVSTQGWSDGAPCILGASRVFATAGDAGACQTDCECQGVPGSLRCTTSCPPPATSLQPPPGCGVQGAQCNPLGQNVCSVASDDGCQIGCACDASVRWQCAKTCPNACGTPSGEWCGVCDGGSFKCGHQVLVGGLGIDVGCQVELCPGEIVGVPL